MATRSCRECGRSFESAHEAGRPREFCPDHQDDRKARNERQRRQVARSWDLVDEMAADDGVVIMPLHRFIQQLKDSGRPYRLEVVPLSEDAVGLLMFAEQA